MVRTCMLCGKRSRLISRELGVCLECIRSRMQETAPIIAEAHRRAREPFGLPGAPPRDQGGVRCGLCARDCVIPSGERGFCGLRCNDSGRLIHLAGTPSRGLLHWYRDPLPTNCVADWVCAGHRQIGMHNLAVFYASCTLDCLFCQNWHFRAVDASAERQDSIEALSAQALANCATPKSYCVCFFGGDPASQMPHALAVGKKLAERGVVVCWETAGTMHQRFLDKAMELALESGGCMKFDLKAYSQDLHRALTGASNERTLENFARAAARARQRATPPALVASTLLVPGYVDPQEVGQIAAFIASLDADIPYALLAFHPHFRMDDLPRTSLAHAMEAEEAAREAGLRNVRLGNLHLLSQAY